VGDDPACGAACLRRVRRDAGPGALAIQRTRFLLVFIVILVALFAAELTRPVQAAFVVPWTDALARISAGLITLFDPRVAAFGKILQSTANGFAISIEAGCNGIEAALILIAAMLAFPAPWKHRAIGIAAGLVAVQLLNIVRVVSLFYLGQWSLRAFEWAHLYLWQALIMVDVLIVWLFWIRTLPPKPPGLIDAEARQASAA
jgi:exosortase H (IPTLxxWG-CTERM-specific)